MTLTNKEKMELLNLRKRVSAQREEIKMLRKEIIKLQSSSAFKITKEK